MMTRWVVTIDSDASSTYRVLKRKPTGSFETWGVFDSYAAALVQADALNSLFSIALHLAEDKMEKSDIVDLAQQAIDEAYGQKRMEV